MGLVIWFLCLLYSSVATSNSSSASKLTGTDKVLLSKDDGSGGDVEAGTVRDNEEDEVSKCVPYQISNLLRLHPFLPKV